MRTTRLLAAMAIGALVAVPGFALAQGPPAETPPADVPVGQPDAPEPTETEEATSTPAPASEQIEQIEQIELAAQVEGEDPGHGEVISTLATCLPSGQQLHGTGMNKGFIISQVASVGEVELVGAAGTETVATVADAEALCAVVAALAEEAEAPETAKGRPDWAGPPDGQGSAEHGPPDHARARQNRGS